MMMIRRRRRMMNDDDDDSSSRSQAYSAQLVSGGLVCRFPVQLMLSPTSA
jgi:pilus assembly protein TadC